MDCNFQLPASRGFLPLELAKSGRIRHKLTTYISVNTILRDNIIQSVMILIWVFEEKASATPWEQ